jgi:hypothetical protein
LRGLDDGLAQRLDLLDQRGARPADPCAWQLDLRDQRRDSTCSTTDGVVTSS